MASPVAAVRQPLAQITTNTAFYPTTTTTATRPAVDKPIAGTKRLHSQINGGQENNNNNVQQQILRTAITFKSPALPSLSRQTSQLQPSPPPTERTVFRLQPSSNQTQPHQSQQFKQPPSTKLVTVTPHQRQDTHNPGIVVAEKDVEMGEWRKAMKNTFSTSTFYFDGLEETFQEQATRFLNRHGGVQIPTSVFSWHKANNFCVVESCAIFLEFG